MELRNLGFEDLMELGFRDLEISRNAKISAPRVPQVLRCLSFYGMKVNLACPVTARSGGGCYPARTAKIVNRGSRDGA